MTGRAPIDADRAAFAALDEQPGAAFVAEPPPVDDPTRWIARSVKLRQLGEAKRADAELQRPVERSPQFPVPDEARGRARSSTPCLPRRRRRRLH